MKIFALDEMVICDGEGQNDWLSFSNDIHGLPSVRAQMAGRSGRHPVLANIERAGRQFSMLSYFPSNNTAASKNALLAWLAGRESRRVVGVDSPIPSAATDNVLAWFGPWDVYNNAGVWLVRDVMRGDDLTAAFTGSWYTEPGEGVQFAPAFTNLITNPSCETNTTGYEAQGAGVTVTRSADWSLFGGYSAKVITPGTTTPEGIRMPVTAQTAISTEYTFTAWVKGVGTFRLRMYDSDAGEQYGDVYILTAVDGFVRLQMTATFGTGAARYVYILTSATQALTFYADGLQLEERAYANPHVNGDMPGCSWTGTAHASTSTWVATRLTAADVELPASGTLLGWFKTPAAMADCGINRRLFDHGGNNGVVLTVSTSDLLQAYVGGASRVTHTLTGANFAVDTWYHVAMTWDAVNSQTKLYLSGAQVGSTGAYAKPTDDDGGLDIGHGGGSSQWIGQIDGAVMLDSVLSAADFSVLNTAGRSGINPRWLNAVCLDSKPMQFNRITTDAGLTSLFQVDGDVAWRQRDGDAEFWTVYATGASRSVVNRGNLPAFPQFRITPKTAKAAGFTKMRWVAVKWTVDNAATRYPVDLSNGGLNLSADAQADGDDIRVYVNGYEIDRWLAGTLVTAVKIWSNLDFAAGFNMTLNGAISDSVTSLTINEDISDLPETGTLYIGTEALTYTERNIRTRVASGLTRGAKGTTAAAHANAAATYWIQHDVWIYYKDATLTAPSVNDNYKPVFNMATSTNTSWVYATFGEADGLRAGQWQWTDSYYCYGGNHAVVADPWVEVGVKSKGWNIQNYMYLYQPCGMTAMAFTNGEAYYVNTLTSPSGNVYVVTKGVWSDSWSNDYTHSFSAESTWDAWAETVNHINPREYVGLSARSFDADYYIEAADCTITIDDNPVSAVGAAQNAYELACTIENKTTGESVALSLSMVLGDTLIIDTDGRSVVDGDGAGHLSARTLSSVRTEWLQLAPGTNVLAYTEAGVVEVDIEILWDTRSAL